MSNGLKVGGLQLASAVLVLLIVVIAAYLLTRPQLSDVEAAIKTDYTDIEHISGAELNNLDPHELVFFDVREPDEYGVSHLAGAVHIDPATDPQEFLENYGELLAGKHAVFYCSVGQRSSAFLSQLGNAPKALGAKSTANLVGGVFGWANSGRKLEDKSGTLTNKVHPYNQVWGKLLDDQSNVSYEPGG